MWKKVDNVNHVDSPPASAAEAVIDLVHTVMHQFRSTQYQALRDGPHDVTHMESKVMAFFARHQGATLSEVVQHSGRDKAQVARLIKGLRERGLLQAEADESDRRNLRLTLTGDGEAVQRQLQQQARRLRAAAVAGLDAARHRELVELLQHLKRNLDAQ